MNETLTNTMTGLGALGVSMLVTLTVVWALFIVVEASADVWQHRREERRRVAQQAADLQQQMNDSITSMQVAYWQARQRLRDEADRARE